MSVALATCATLPPEFDDDELIVESLARRGIEAKFVRWDDRQAEWERFELIVIRSTWDYTHRLGEFVAWADSLDGRLRNSAELVRWNSDKRYLGDLGAAGLPVVPTRYMETVGATELEGEVVVKPTVSAGGRDTGRFGRRAHQEARRLIAQIVESGRTAMVQPYLDAVDRDGETALVFIAGELAHVLGKRAVLVPDEVAPVRDDSLGAAEAMYDPALVRISAARADEVEIGREVIAHLRERFATAPLIVRLDLVRNGDGAPCVLELEAVEPNLYLRQAPATAERLAEAIIAELARRH